MPPQSTNETENDAPSSKDWNYYDSQYTGTGSLPSAGQGYLSSHALPGQRLGSIVSRVQSFGQSFGRSQRPAWMVWLAVLIIIAVLGTLGSIDLFAGGSPRAPKPPLAQHRVPKASPTAHATPVATTTPEASPTAHATPVATTTPKASPTAHATPTAPPKANPTATPILIPVPQNPPVVPPTVPAPHRPPVVPPTVPAPHRPPVVPPTVPAPQNTPVAPPPIATPVQGSQNNQGNQMASLPPVWTNSGRGETDLLEAENVAEAFVARYESLDWRSQSSFDQATLIMTQGARTRFWQQDERANQAFIMNFENNRISQTAQVEHANTQMLNAVQDQNTFFVWISITYTLLHQQQNQPDVTDKHTMVVLLASVPFGINNVIGGIGWEASSWQEGNATFPIPTTV